MRRVTGIVTNSQAFYDHYDFEFNDITYVFPTFGEYFVKATRKDNGLVIWIKFSSITAIYEDGDNACDEIKCYSENQIKEYAVNFASFLLKKISLTELSDLTFDKNYEECAKNMLEEYQNTKNEEMK
ncbi:hypothetical protein GHI93_11435 [Lactococcus hircilactis]|uniref:Uncharacterized protein n=1 Tax=Lactococcus hircilactis TaxID=1494462 RepID=A0A7X1ZC17_9LACT|nr:hypothetical protein [Lactococcus hircilactis]MQW40532.1 hypothetical protein [Lactococcus hircilactis]